MNRLNALVYGLSIGFWCLTSGYALLASRDERVAPALCGLALASQVVARLPLENDVAYAWQSALVLPLVYGVTWQLGRRPVGA